MSVNHKKQLQNLVQYETGSSKMLTDFMKKALRLTLITIISGMVISDEAAAQCYLRTCDTYAEAESLRQYDCDKSPCGCFNLCNTSPPGVSYGQLTAHFYYVVLYSDGSKKCFYDGYLAQGLGYNYLGICSDPTDPCCGSVDHFCSNTDPTTGNPYGDITPIFDDPGKAKCETGNYALAGKP